MLLKEAPQRLHLKKLKICSKLYLFKKSKQGEKLVNKPISLSLVFERLLLFQVGRATFCHQNVIELAKQAANC